MGLEHPKTGEEVQGRLVLTRIAEETGGLAFFPPTVNDLTHIYAKIAEALRHQYQFRYQTSNPQKNGSLRCVSLIVRHPGIQAQDEGNYYAPKPPNGLLLVEVRDEKGNAVETPFELFDAKKQTIGSDYISGEEYSLPKGTYHLILHTAPQRTFSVTIEGEQLTRISKGYGEILVTLKGTQEEKERTWVLIDGKTNQTLVEGNVKQPQSLLEGEYLFSVATFPPFETRIILKPGQRTVVEIEVGTLYVTTDNPYLIEAPLYIQKNQQAVSTTPFEFEKTIPVLPGIYTIRAEKKNGRILAENVRIVAQEKTTINVDKEN